MQKLQELITEKDSRLFTADDTLPSESCWLIVRGAVKTFSRNEERKIITLGYWGANDLVGQHLSNLDYYQMYCLTCVEAICIPVDILPEFSTNLIQRARQQTVWICIIQTKRASERVFLLLKWLATKFSRPVVQGQLIDLRLTHREIADILGTNRVTVTRIINRFEQQGIIARPKQHYIILCNSDRRI